MSETPDLRALLGGKYVETIRAAVLADNPDAIRDAQLVGGDLGKLMYLSAVDRLHRVLAAVLPDLLAEAWGEGFKVGVRSGYRDALPVRPENPYRPTEGDPA